MLKGLPATRSGEVEREGCTVRYEIFGSGERALFLLPTWSIVHSDFWRRQVPHLSDRYTVLTFDGLGNGASDRPTDSRYYSDEGFIEDAVNVMNAAGIEQAVTMSVSMGAGWQLLLADRFPERISACVYIATDLPLAPLPPGYAEAVARFDEQLTDHEGWMMWNRRFWHQDWPAFCEFFFSQCFTEPNSEEEIAHFLSMGLETDPEVIAATIDAVGLDEEEARRAAADIKKPTMIIHGDQDAISSIKVARELALLSDAELVILPGCGHEPQCRVPAQVNALLDSFLERHCPPI